MDDQKIFGIAASVIKRFDDLLETNIYCTQQAEIYAMHGNMDGRREWQRVQATVRELTRQPRDGESVN